ncbi:hypothetical protein [Saccharothrix syringae]|uniref:hypothetical protein n=1 Tax=Saccharothrix syringae TaxID=103733 RepID=UPI0005248CF9|nr:hypothetical protein [Saccharothrix syringae]
MNLRKTIAGVTLGLGSTVAALGLGGTAHAAEVGAEARPDVEAEPGQLARVGDLVDVDTNELAQRVEALKPRDLSLEGLGRHLQRRVAPQLEEQVRRDLPVDLDLRLGS